MRYAISFLSFNLQFREQYKKRIYVTLSQIFGEHHCRFLTPSIFRPSQVQLQSHTRHWVQNYWFIKLNEEALIMEPTSSDLTVLSKFSHPSTYGVYVWHIFKHVSTAIMWSYCHPPIYLGNMLWCNRGHLIDIHRCSLNKCFIYIYKTWKRTCSSYWRLYINTHTSKIAFDDFTSIL